MSKQISQVEMINRIAAEGMKQGYISYTDINDLLEGVKVDIESIDDIYEALEAKGIEVVTDREKRAKRLKRITWLLFVIMCVGASLYLVNEYFIKLEYLWSIILERIKMIA